MFYDVVDPHGICVRLVLDPHEGICAAPPGRGGLQAERLPRGRIDRGQRARAFIRARATTPRMDAVQQRRDASLSMLENALLILEGQELEGERTRLNAARERLGRLVENAAAPTRDDFEMPTRRAPRRGRRWAGRRRRCDEDSEAT